MQRHSHNSQRGILMAITLAILFNLLLSTVAFANCRGKVFILSDPNVAALGGDMAASDPQRLLSLLNKVGFETRTISVMEMANNLILNYQECDVLILPYGPYFPSTASDNFQAFVRRGGKFICMGGYAFAEQIGKDYHKDPNALPLSSRQGEATDHLILDSWQFPIFDWDYELRHAVKAVSAENQYLFKGELGLEGDIHGWSACGLIADNKARWRPLISSVNRYGQLCGSIGAITHIFPDNKPGQIVGKRLEVVEGYEGFESSSDYIHDILQCYSGSSWAYFGVTNHDLFSGKYPAMDQGLINLLDYLIKDVYLKHVLTDRTSYHQGESVKLLTDVCNGGKRIANGKVVLTIAGTDFIKEVPFVVGPAKVQHFEVLWTPGVFHSDSYEISVVLKDQNDITTDSLKQVFTIWNPELIKSKPAFEYKDNYFSVNKKNVFVIGTDVAWRMFGGLDFETPVRWQQDFQKRQDNGILLLECLQQAGRKEDEATLRRVETTLQLAYKHNQIYMMGLLIGKNVAATDGEMQYQADWVERVAKRYQGFNNIIYYLNGDLRIHITPQLQPLWNDFLKERYGNIDTLKMAWGKDCNAIKNFGDIPIEDYSTMGTNDWLDAKCLDYNLFRTSMIRRWTSNLIKVIRKYNTKSPIVCEFYSWPWESVDIPWGIGDLTLSNIGFFEPYNTLPGALAYSDQRYRGKSCGIGEFGKRTHPSFKDAYAQMLSSADEEHQKQYYLNVLLDAYSLGASHAFNWCWNDDDWTYFPWGLNHMSDYVPRDILYIVRNCNMFFKQMEPVWRSPLVAFLTADNNRLSSDRGDFKIQHSIENAAQTLISAWPGEVCTLNEANLSIPETVKLIYYPLPYLPPEHVLKKLEQFVKSGGMLYISGDISFDELTRKRNKTRWLKQLCGVQFVSENYPNLTIGGNPVEYCSMADGNSIRKGYPGINIRLAGAKTMWQTKDGQPIIVCNQLGHGKVIFSTDPLELHPANSSYTNAFLYKSIMTLADIKSVDAVPYDPNLNAVRLQLRDGGNFYCFTNNSTSVNASTITLNEVGHPVTVNVSKGHPCALWFDGSRNLRGAESYGQLKIGSKLILDGNSEGIIFTPDRCSLDKAENFVFLPFKPGNLDFLLPTINNNAYRAEVGEIYQSKWLSHEMIKPEIQAGRLKISIDPLQATKIIIISKDGDTRKVVDSAKILPDNSR